MTPRLVRSVTFSPVLFLLAAGIALAAEPTRPASSSVKSTTPASKSDPRRTTGKAVLPDPALLDGAQHPAEKRSEQGMIGDFELPGDENARNDRVAGQAGAPGAQPEQEQQQQQGGGGGQPPNPAEQQQAQAGGAGQQQQQQQGGSQQGGQGTPIASPEGMQVASLQGEGGGNPGDVPAGQKPPQVTIGDSAMQIKTQPNAPSVVGAQQPAGQTQQHEKATGTGGRPPTGNNTNRGAERGRAMPAGL